MDAEQMPKVDLNKDLPRLTTSDLHYMKRVGEENLERVIKLKKYRKKNRFLGSCLAAVAASIYCYTLYAIKQEKFFDNFDEPEKEPGEQ